MGRADTTVVVALTSRMVLRGLGNFDLYERWLLLPVLDYDYDIHLDHYEMILQ